MKRRILLVDDELAILLTLKAVLEINGFEAARKAQYKPAIAMLTAFPASGAEIEDGADEVLVKPMNTQDLLVQIEALLVTHEDKKRVRSERDLALAGVAHETGTTKRSSKAAGASK